MLLFSGQIKKSISHELANTFKSVQVISAFCKKEAILFFEAQIKNNISDKVLMVRFTYEDIVSGASDLSVYEICKKNNWKMYIRFDLHAKTYIFDSLRCIVGSANLTSRGIALQDKFNIEISSTAVLSEEDKDKVNQLFNDAILMTDDLHDKMTKEILSCDKSTSTTNNWSDDILSLFTPSKIVLFTDDLPGCFSPNDSNASLDFINMHKKSDMGTMQKSFRSSKAFAWLYKTLLSKKNKVMYFGEMTEKLHNSFINDPAPYRKEVKQLLSNLLNWVVELNIEEIIIDKPNYSQRITLLEV